ncbi:MAG: hypothetical protein ACRDZP_04095, partial [Acidimicrobiales bacterium]
RSVLTLADPGVEAAALAVARSCLELLDISRHEGVHPRLGVVDVVPFVLLDGTLLSDEGALLSRGEPDVGGGREEVAARDRFSQVFSEDGVPCFYYGPERSLPEVRRRAWRDLLPDAGPTRPHPTAGACCTGARALLVAYNLFVRGTLADARAVAGELRSQDVRTLAFEVGGLPQVSCNLLDPLVTGPSEAFEAVSQRLPVLRAELVGLLPARALYNIAPERYEELGVSPAATIEARLADRRLY